MIVTKLKRPWEKTSRQGTRYNPDPRYHSKQWKNTRTQHLNSNKVLSEEEWAKIMTVNPSLHYLNKIVSNQFCYPCLLNEGILTPANIVDHNPPVKAGTDFYDLTKLFTNCQKHHAQKSANEGKKQPGR
jgi:hypothetical protein